MSNSLVADYVSEHFIAAYEQKGNFRVREVQGQLVKQGGSVVSYFCTADGRVIHFVVGPVSGERFLTEARWAVDAHRRACSGDTSPRQEQLAMERLHRSAKMESSERNQRSDDRFVAAWFFGEAIQQEGVHSFLARSSLPILDLIADEVFRDYAQQNVRSKEEQLEVENVAEILANYRRQQQPTLLVLYHGGSAAPNANTLVPRYVGKVRREFALVALPSQQLAALSQHVDIEPAKLKDHSFARSQFIVLDATGRQVSAFTRYDGRAKLAAAMQQTMQKVYLEKTERLVDEAKMIEAIAQLRKLAGYPVGRKTAVSLHELVRRIQQTEGEGLVELANVSELLARAIRQKDDNVPSKLAVGLRKAHQEMMLKRAVSLFEVGQLKEAKRLCRKISVSPGGGKLREAAQRLVQKIESAEADTDSKTDRPVTRYVAK